MVCHDDYDKDKFIEKSIGLRDPSQKPVQVFQCCPRLAADSCGIYVRGDADLFAT